jgi:hypothetical protein
MTPSKKTVGRCCCAAAIMACTSCASTTKPNVDLTITEGKQVKRITGRIPETTSNPIQFVLGIGADALKFIFPAL